MIKHISLTFFLVLSVSFCIAQQYGFFKDTVNGKAYTTVKIGQQRWMAEELRSTQFRDGSSIFHAKNCNDWNYANSNKIPAWCYYEFDKTNFASAGILYNWYAVNDPKGLAPEGWLIPDNSDWNNLVDFLGAGDRQSKVIAGNKMMNRSSTSWGLDQNTGSSGFNAKPKGTMGRLCSTISGNQIVYWWSANSSNEASSWAHGIDFSYNGSSHLISGTISKSCGLSVRCLQRLNDK